MNLKFSFRSPEATVAMLTLRDGQPVTSEFKSIVDLRVGLVHAIDLRAILKDAPAGVAGSADEADYVMATHVADLESLIAEARAKIDAIKAARNDQ